MSLVELARYASPIDAELDRQRLDGAMIDAVLFDAGMSSVYPAAGLVEIRLMVLDDDLELARETLGLSSAAGAPPGRG
ncbi:DUF2007 domain-containing protein [Sphingomonas sp. ASV193]|uniref:putative signal transducing protein n=1 Tax=Sphingomonas sp. ASV193 TaxID=3144405 RepID=UPI0032E8B740